MEQDGAGGTGDEAGGTGWGSRSGSGAGVRVGVVQGMKRASSSVAGEEAG